MSELTPTKRKRRQPVACEACRERKIRCSRDGQPCSTCVRRRVRCWYAAGVEEVQRQTQAAHVPPSPQSQNGATDLAQRVQKLEELLRQAQYTAQSLPSQLTPSSEGTSHGNRATDGGLRGNLRQTDGGYVRYIPSCDGWSHSSKGSGLAGVDFTAAVSTRQPFTPSANIPTALKTLLSRLPPIPQCTELVQIYTASFASLFHLLHDPTFQAQYNSFLANPSSATASWLALLYAILATAVLALDGDSSVLNSLSRERDAAEKVADLSEQYRRAAFACLEADHYFWNHNVGTLQALILLIYGISHSYGPTWTLLGLTHHLAISIGCHVDPEELGLSMIECEERRRCWACLSMLYTNQSTTLGGIGNPQILQQNATTRPPLDCNDHELAMGHPVATAGATQMSYMLLKFRLYDICSDICSNVLGRKDTSYDMVKQIDASIVNEQHTWDARYLDDSRSGPLEAYHLAHLNILWSYSSHLLLLLHQFHATQGAATPEALWSETRSIQTATRLLEIHATMSDSPELAPFRWYTRGLGSFHAFHAAVILFNLLPSIALRANACEVHAALRGCTTRFEQMSDMSPLCSKAAPVLRRLV